MCVGKEEDGFFKLGDFIIHLVFLDVRLEMRQVVDSTLAMGSCDDESRILAYILCDFGPSSFHC